MRQRTLVIVKPDAVEKNLIGEVTGRFEAKGLRVTAMKMLHISKGQAEGFYAVHRGKPFFESLTSFMSSGQIVAMVLEGEEAISLTRELMGATDPHSASPGTIRRDLGDSIERNVVHASDSPGAAAFEISYFFTSLELHGI